MKFCRLVCKISFQVFSISQVQNLERERRLWIANESELQENMYNLQKELGMKVTCLKFISVKNVHPVCAWFWFPCIIIVL